MALAMRYYQSIPIIVKAVEKLARLKGVDIESKDLSADQWKTFFLVMLKHIDDAQRQ